MPCCIEYALNMYGERFPQCFNHYVDVRAGNSWIRDMLRGRHAQVQACQVGEGQRSILRAA